MVNVTVGFPPQTYELPQVGQWLVVQQRLDGNLSFNQLWINYTQGADYICIHYQHTRTKHRGLPKIYRQILKLLFIVCPVLCPGLQTECRKRRLIHGLHIVFTVFNCLGLLGCIDLCIFLVFIVLFVWFVSTLAKRLAGKTYSTHDIFHVDGFLHNDMI